MQAGGQTRAGARHPTPGEAAGDRCVGWGVGGRGGWRGSRMDKQWWQGTRSEVHARACALARTQMLERVSLCAQTIRACAWCGCVCGAPTTCGQPTHRGRQMRAVRLNAPPPPSLPAPSPPPGPGSRVRPPPFSHHQTLARCILPPRMPPWPHKHETQPWPLTATPHPRWLAQRVPTCPGNTPMLVQALLPLAPWQLCEISYGIGCESACAPPSTGSPGRPAPTLLLLRPRPAALAPAATAQSR